VPSVGLGGHGTIRYHCVSCRRPYGYRAGSGRSDEVVIIDEIPEDDFLAGCIERDGSSERGDTARDKRENECESAKRYTGIIFSS